MSKTVVTLSKKADEKAVTTTNKSMMRMGFPWYVTYAGLLILLHHLWLFFVELHRFDAFLGTFLRALLSAAFTFALCLLAQFLTSGQERDRR